MCLALWYVNRDNIRSCNPTPGYISVQKDTRTTSPNVYITIIYNSQDMEAFQMLDKEGVVYIHNGLLLSYKKKNKIMPFAAIWMDPEIVILSELSQTKTNVI